MRLLDIWPIGTRVKVRLGWRDGISWRETEVGTVVGHEMNADHDRPFVDNVVLFERGETEPFSNGELQKED